MFFIQDGTVSSWQAGVSNSNVMPKRCLFRLGLRVFGVVLCFFRAVGFGNCLFAVGSCKVGDHFTSVCECWYCVFFPCFFVIGY